MPALGLLVALLLVPPERQLITLEIRVFHGSTDVTRNSRVTVHRAGERGDAVGVVRAGSPRVAVEVPAGIYDAQAIHEQNGRVLNLRWAERLVVMPYPDEAGHHLEVINLTPGYGALQIRAAQASTPVERVMLFPGGVRGERVASAAGREPYILFVAAAGQYDLQVTRGSRTAWYPNVEVPADRTRLWLVP